jgi:hypothetical protein
VVRCQEVFNNLYSMALRYSMVQYGEICRWKIHHQPIDI